MKHKIGWIALVTILAACGGKGTQTGDADITHKDSSTAPAAPVEAMPPDTSKTAKPDSQTQKASNNQEHFGPRKGGGG